MTLAGNEIMSLMINLCRMELICMVKNFRIIPEFRILRLSLKNISNMR